MKRRQAKRTTDLRYMVDISFTSVCLRLCQLLTSSAEPTLRFKMEGASSRTSVITIMISPIENPNLPFDIIFEVIHHLESDANALTLRALSTTCHILRGPSQRKLFCKLTILVTSGQPSASKHDPPTYFALNDLFNTSPYLATYVRHLTVTFKPPYPPTVSIIASVLDKMCSITSLGINHVVWPHEYLEKIPQLRECASVVLCRPTLRKLDLSQYGELPASVWQIPTLTNIDLGYWWVEDVDNEWFSPYCYEALGHFMDTPRGPGRPKQIENVSTDLTSFDPSHGIVH